MSRPSMMETLTDISARDAIEEIFAHLGAAKSQLTEKDDAIISAHIIAAHALARALFRSINK